MKNIRNYILLFVLVGFFTACDSFFEPEFNNNLTEETVFDYQTNPEYIAGLYVPAYNAIPGSYNTFGGDFLDCATDNAVSNDYNSTAWKMHTIADYLTARNYPIYSWGSNYQYIHDIYNFFKFGLEDDIVYKTSDENRNTQVKARMKGEAYFLLALNYFELLRDYAGPVDGEIMGVPLVKGHIDAEEAKAIERAPYAEVVDFIVENLDSALAAGLLPEYSDNYVAIHSDEGLQSTVYGDNVAGLPTTISCNMLKSRLYLYAASPAFTVGKSDAEIKALNEKAAMASKMVIDEIGELPKIYNPYSIDNDFYTATDNNKELILRRASQTNYWEQVNFPPSLGLTVGGRTNPSQNLVDAFPMANGYPIADGNSGYDEFDPYWDRDPRFYMTVIHNNAFFKNTAIEMWEGGNTQIGAPNISDDSRVSRTNYYLRKWITEKPSFIAGVASETPWHFAAYFRAVEAYLNFAEAANAAVGPDGMIDGLSARQALRAVRERAGVPAFGDASVASDAYLAGLGDISNLIKNERRIELCFEGHRFYDIRRWNDELNTQVKKVNVATEDEGWTFNYDFSEDVYPNQVSLPEYMRYGAIPKSEINNCPGLKQNDGWK